MMVASSTTYIRIDQTYTIITMTIMTERDRVILPRLDHRCDRRSCQPAAADEAAAVGAGKPSSSSEADVA